MSGLWESNSGSGLSEHLKLTGKGILSYIESLQNNDRAPLTKETFSKFIENSYNREPVDYLRNWYDNLPYTIKEEFDKAILSDITRTCVIVNSPDKPVRLYSEAEEFINDFLVQREVNYIEEYNQFKENGRNTREYN